MNPKITANVRVVYDRKNEASSKKAALVQLEVRADGKRKFYSTGVKVYKAQFRSGRVCGRADAAALNDRIDTLYRRVVSVINDCVSQNIAFSFDMLSPDAASASFIDYIINRVRQRHIAHDTARQHLMVARFLKEEYKKIQSFSDLTRQNIAKLDEYLHNRTLPDGRFMAQPTIYKYHKVIKIYINDALQAGILSVDPYEHLKVKPGSYKTRYALTAQELTQFMEYVPPTDFLQKIKDLFLVQCFTGLAYVDLMGTDFTAAECVNGEYVLNRSLRQKTHTRFIIVLLPPVLAILRKYDFLLPHLAYDVYNRHLKALAVAAGINKTVTTHIGRHTFATTVALGSGISLEVLAKMLGHTNVKTTQIYAKILPEQVLQAFGKIKSNM